MANVDATSYLVVKISDLVDEKYIGCKCIPACWAVNPSSNNNYLIVHYPEAENSETRLQVKNKEPAKQTWPLYSALIMLRTECYEKALEFIAENENDTDALTIRDELPDSNNINNTAVSSPPTSTSLKRRKSGDSPKNEANLPKKKRESAIRSEKNLKKLIQNGQVDTNKQQKVSPKKVLSLRKEALTDTLSRLSSGKNEKLDNLHRNTIEATLQGPTENVETSDSDTETLPLDRNRLEPPNTVNVPNTAKTEHTISMPNKSNTTSVPNSTHTSKIDTPALHSLNNSRRSKSPYSDSEDRSATQISSSNNVEELDIGSDVSCSSLNADVLSLHNLIRGLAPDNSGNKTQHSTVDIEHIKEIYKTVLEVKRKLNAVYKEKSIKLRKAYASIKLFVPELRRGLTLPSLEELKEESVKIGKEPTLLASQKGQPIHRKFTSSQQPLRSSETEESSSESPEPSISFPKCSYIAEWTLKHKGPGSGLTELLPNSNVYVDEVELVRSKLLAKDMKHLARLIFPSIFSKDAIYKHRCSYFSWRKGKRPKSADEQLNMFDEHATNVLEAFLKKHAKQSGWSIVSSKQINQTLSAKLRTQGEYYLLSKRL